MVSIDIDRLLDYISELPLLSRGAESEIRLGTWMGCTSIFKVRIPHRYMHPRLDAHLRRVRTRREAKLLIRAARSGASVPRVLAVLPSIGVIVMEYIDGVVLRDLLNSGRYLKSIIVRAGEVLGKLHKINIAHGDPTTSNYIVANNRVYMIDFGLAEVTNSIEDLAVDIHLFRRAVESTHTSIANDIFRDFKRGYLNAAGMHGYKVLERAEIIRLRGRYVEERRKTVWHA